MHGPKGSEASRRTPPEPRPEFPGLLRWVVAGAFAMTITFALFAAMPTLVDGAWILDRVLRFLPGEETPVADPCEAEEAPLTAVTIEGVVGYSGPAGFVPLADAEIVGEHAPEDGQPVEVSERGVFRFVTGFAEERPSACGEAPERGAARKRLLIRAAGCTPREVRVTRSWVPHRVLLDCEARV
jgi:hypothetical protein